MKPRFILVLLLLMALMLISGFIVNVIAQEGEDEPGGFWSFEEGDIGVISVETAELKTEPRNFCQTLMVLEINQEVFIDDYNENWYYIITENGEEGWINKELVNNYNSVSTTSSDDLNVGDSSTAGAMGLQDFDEEEKSETLEEYDMFMMTEEVDESPEEEIGKEFKVSDLSGFTYMIFDEYVESVENADFDLIDGINSMTAQYTINPYEAFPDFREEGQLGEFVPYQLDDVSYHPSTDAEQAYHMKQEYQDILLRRGLKEEEKYYIGVSAVLEMLTEYNIYYDEELTQYVNQIGQTIAMASNKPTTYKGYRFIVLDEDKELSFSTPSGHVFISKGLIKSLESEDELAGILAVEVASIAREVLLDTISDELMDKVFAVFANMVAESNELEKGIEKKETYFALLSDNMGDITNIYQQIIDEVVNGVENMIAGKRNLNAKKAAVVSMYYAGYNPHALLETGMNGSSVYPFEEGRAFVGDYSESESPIKVFIEDLGIETPSISKGRTSRFASYKSNID